MSGGCVYHASKCLLLRLANSTAFHKHIIPVLLSLLFPMLTHLADSKASFDHSDRKSLPVVPMGFIYKITIKHGDTCLYLQRNRLQETTDLAP